MKIIGTKQELVEEWRGLARKRRAGEQPSMSKMTSQQLLGFAQGLEFAASQLEILEEDIRPESAR
jgi:hypothetical protein